MVPHFLGVVRRVDEYRGAFFGFAEHVVFIQEVKHMHADKVRRLDEVRRANVFFAEADVGGRHRAGFFGVVDEVPLGKETVGADDFHRVFVGAYGAVGTQTVEQRGENIVGGFVFQFGFGQREVGQIVFDADGELFLGFFGGQVVKHGFDVRRRKVFGADSVAAADDERGRGEFGFGFGRQERGANVLEQGFAQGAGFFGAVHDRYFFDGGRNGFYKIRNGEGAEQFYFQHAHFLALHGFHGVLGYVRAGTHNHD